MDSIETIAQQFEALGWWRHPDRLHPSATALQGPRVDGPDCDCNGKPPSVCVRLFPAFAGATDSASFAVFGEAGGVWVDATIYSIDARDALANADRARDAAGAIWRAFVASGPWEVSRG